MKSKIFNIALLFILVISVSSCDKEGCTHYLATNYDDSVSKDDGSCTFKSKAVFYANGSENGGNITVKVEGKVIGELTNYRTEISNLCNEGSVLFWFATEGTYTYEATRKNSSEVWKGTFNLSNSSCVPVIVNPNPANKVPGSGKLEYNITSSVDSNTITYGNGINIINECNINYRVIISDTGYSNNIAAYKGQQFYTTSLAECAYTIKIEYLKDSRYSPVSLSNCAVHEESFGPFELKTNDLLTFIIKK